MKGPGPVLKSALKATRPQSFVILGSVICVFTVSAIGMISEVYDKRD